MWRKGRRAYYTRNMARVSQHGKSLAILTAVLHVSTSFSWSGAWQGTGRSSAYASWSCRCPQVRLAMDIGSEPITLRKHRRDIMYAAGCVAGGIWLPARSWASSKAGSEGAPPIDGPIGGPLLNGEVPFSFNELDPGTAEALSQEEELLSREETLAVNDAIFAFRGEQLLKTNTDGAISYMSRRNAVFFGMSPDQTCIKARTLSR